MDSFIENKKILYVDDEPELLKSFTSLLRKQKLIITTLSDSNKIEEILETSGPFAVILSDQRMPGYDGVKVLETAKKKFPESIRVLVTGYSDYKDTIRAINDSGINSYISKPWKDDELIENIDGWIEQYNLRVQNKFLLNALNEENKKLTELLEGTVAQTIRILGDITNAAVPRITSAGEKVKNLGYAFLKTLTNLTMEERWEISRAFDLFNLGVALLPTSLQLAIEKQNLSAFEDSHIVNNHHLLAAGLLKDIPRFARVAKIIEFQSKDFNGKGEPEKSHVKGKDIPLGSRILHVLIDLVKKSDGGSTGREILGAMIRNPLRYDTDIIKLLLGENSGIDVVTEIRELLLSEIKSGMVAAENIETLRGQMLLKANVALAETSLNILLQWHKKDPIKEPIKVRKPL